MFVYVKTFLYLCIRKKNKLNPERDMITQFINYQKHVRGLSQQTCEEYEKNLRTFARWAQPKGLRWSTTTKQDIDKWTYEMSVQNYSESTIKQRISTLRTFYSWLNHEGKTNVNPARFCQTPKLPDRIPRAADMENIDKWLAEPAKTKEEEGVKMLTAIICETGLRLGETLALRKSDFQKCGIIVKGKGRRERIVFYGHRTIDAVRKYAPLTDELFPTWTQEHMRYAMYRTLGKVVAGVHPHMLRHTFAMDRLNNGMSINEVGQLLGHKNITTTQIYARSAVITLQNNYYKSLK